MQGTARGRMPAATGARNSLDAFGVASVWRSSRAPVKTSAGEAMHITNSMLSTSDDNFHGRRWKKNDHAPADQMAPGRMSAVDDIPHRRKIPPSPSSKDTPGAEDAFREIPETASNNVVPLGTSNKLEPNGILSGAGVSEVPWPSKRRVEPKSSSEHCRPGALVTDGHGAVQWAGLDRKSQNLMQSTSDLKVPSPHRNARRMIPQGPGSAQFQFSASTYSGATSIPARVPPHLRESQTTPRKPSPTRVPPHLKTSIRTASQGMTSATPRDEGNVGSVGAEKSVSKNWSGFPSVVTHSISPTRGTKVPNVKCGISLDTSIVSSLKSTAMGSDTGAECGSTFSSRTGSVVSQRPTTAQSKVPPHLQTSLSTAPWEHGDLNPTNRAGCTGRTTKRIYERPKSAFVTGASTAPWGVDT